MDKAQLEQLRTKAKAKRDAEYAAADARFDETIAAIEHVAALLGDAVEDGPISRRRLSTARAPRPSASSGSKDTTARKIREAIKGIEVGQQFDSLDIRRAVYGVAELDRNKAGAFSSTVKRIAKDEGLARIIIDAKGRMPARYERIGANGH